MTAKERAEHVDIELIDKGDATCSDYDVDYEATHDNIAAAIEAAVQEEREACAKIAEGMAESFVSDNPAIMAARQGQWGVAMEIAESIRERD